MKQFALLCAAAAVTVTTTLSAAPLDRKTLPADCQWVLHLDMDAARGTESWKYIQDKLEGNGEFLAKVQQVEDLAQMRLPEDLQGLTLFGSAYGERNAVIVIHATMNQTRLLTMVQMSPSYAAEAHGIYNVVSWQDNGKTLFGVFPTPGELIISQSKEGVSAALDAIDAKQNVAKTPELTTPPASPILYAASANVQQMLKERGDNNPVLKQITAAVLAIGQVNDQMHLVGDVLATSEQTAQQLKVSGEGLKGMLMLMSGSDTADPRLKIAAQAVQSATLAQTGNRVNLNWAVPITTLLQLADPSATAPTTKP